MNGIWSASPASEEIRQSKYSRHRVITVNTGQTFAAGWNASDWSGMASMDPNTIAPNTHVPGAGDRGPEGGPHFVMSGVTPDDSHTYGFEFALFVVGILPVGNRALPAVGGYTVTVWELVAATQYPGGPGASSAFTPVWISFDVQTGVGLQEAWHSFDCNAAALRFQITNLAADPAVNNFSINIAFTEL